MDRVAELQLRMQLALIQAQSLERDIVVLNYKRLMEEANTYQQEINKIQEEVIRNEMLKNSAGIEPVDPDPTVE